MRVMQGCLHLNICCSKADHQRAIQDRGGQPKAGHALSVFIKNAHEIGESCLQGTWSVPHISSSRRTACQVMCIKNILFALKVTYF